MIQPLRWVVFVLGIAFAYFFGGTLERFVLEVVRFFVSIEPENALAFNLLHLFVLLVPFLLFGLAVSVALSGEPDLQRRFRLVLAGAALGLVAYRAHQVWWVFRGGVGDDVNAWTESLSFSELFFWEKALPFVLLGVAAGLVVALREKETRGLPLSSAWPGVGAFAWLWATHKIQNLSGSWELAAALAATALCGFMAGWAIQKVREF